MALTTIKTYLRSSVAQNAASLYVIQFANYFLPLITVPYVVRVLSPAGYGLVAFGQGLIGYFLIFIDYGFGFSATRKISVDRNDVALVSRTVFDVWGTKLLLALIGLFVLLALIGLISTLRKNCGLLLILYGLALGNVLFPTWLFQGMERMVPISLINLAVRLCVVVGIFTLIKRPEDYLWYAGLNSLGALLAGTIGAATAFYFFTLRPVLPSWRRIWEVLKESWILFLSRASGSLYTVGNPFILGMLTDTTVVGYYSAAEKIALSVLGLTGPLAQAAYPRFSKMASDSKILALLWGRRMLLLMGGIGLGLSIGLFAFAHPVVNVLLGKQFEPSVNVLRVLSLLPVLVAASNVFGIQIMLPFGKDRMFTSILFGAGLINLLLAIFLTPVWQELGMAIAVLFSEIFVTFSMLAILSIYGLNPLTHAGKR